MLDIKVLGPGCANCRKLEEVAREAVAATGVEAEITKVTDMGQIVAYDVLKTPGLVINEKLVSTHEEPQSKRKPMPVRREKERPAGRSNPVCRRAGSSPEGG